LDVESGGAVVGDFLVVLVEVEVEVVEVFEGPVKLVVVEQAVLVLVVHFEGSLVLLEDLLADAFGLVFVALLLDVHAEPVLVLLDLAHGLADLVELDEVFEVDQVGHRTPLELLTDFLLDVLLDCVAVLLDPGVEVLLDDVDVHDFVFAFAFEVGLLLHDLELDTLHGLELLLHVFADHVLALLALL